MADFQQTIRNIANAIPGYKGYQSKEQRRDADRLLRAQLTRQYEAQRDRLVRIQQDATRAGLIDRVDDLEGVNQQLSRFISRLRVAPVGYAGWFDVPSIQEADLDQIYEFDSKLASGADELGTALDKVSSAVRSREGVDDAIWALRDQLDGLNRQFDAREEFVARGKRPPASLSTPDMPKDKSLPTGIGKPPEPMSTQPQMNKPVEPMDAPPMATTGSSEGMNSQSTTTSGSSEPANPNDATPPNQNQTPT